MKKFWEWMYDEYGWLAEDWYQENSMQMLIGYMIEYLTENGKKHIEMYDVTIDILYKHLEKDIKEIK